MWLRTITTLNWANLPNGTHELAQSVMLTGGTGAGKTTMLDAMQTLMTAGHQDLCTFNAGQDEAKGRSRLKKSRTLASYVLGCDDGPFARPEGAHAYIIGRFEPGPGEAGEPFTALAGFTARLFQDGGERIARTEDELFLVVGGEPLGLEDVTDSQTDEGRLGERLVVATKDLPAHLRFNYPDRPIEPAVSKTEYLQRLYGALCGLRSISESKARNAAKQFARFMVYKPIQHLDQFVREEILEPMDLSEQIEDVSELMQSIQRMRDEAARIKEGVGYLEAADGAARRTIETLADRELVRLEDAWREWRCVERRALMLGEEAERLEQSMQETEHEIRGLDAQLRQLGNRREALAQQSRGSEVVQQKLRLTNQQETQAANLDRAVARLKDGNQHRDRAYDALAPLAKEVDRPESWLPPAEGEPPDWQRLFSRAVQGDSWRGFALSDLIESQSYEALLDQESSVRAIEERYGRVAEAFAHHQEGIRRRYFECKDTLEGLKREAGEHEAAIEQIEQSGRVRYRPSTQRALELLSQNLPGCEPRVLCDYIEVSDEHWQLAIEGLFGNRRFDIIVGERFEAAAIDLINRERRRVGPGVSIIQGKRARELAERPGREPKPDSIVHLMRFSDPVVEAVVRANFGDVVQVADSQALTQTPRGLTLEGNASSSLRMFVTRVEESDLVFGEGARRRSIDAKRRRLKEIEREEREAEVRMRSARLWNQALDSVQRPKLIEPFEEVIQEQMGLEETEQQLKALDLSGVEEILGEIDSLDHEIAAARERHGEAMGRRGEIRQERQTNAESRTAAGNKLQELTTRRDECREQIEAMRRINAEGGDWEGALARIAQSLDDTTRAIAVPPDQRLPQLYANLSSSVTHFNGCGLYDKRVALPRATSQASAIEAFRELTLVHREIGATLTSLRDHILAENHEQLEDASRRFNETFIRDVCLKMNNCINRGKDVLTTLNQELRRQTFGDEYYQFSWNWRSDYRRYAEFFERLAEPGQMMGNLLLFDEEGMSPEDEAIFERLKGMLLDQDRNRGMKELRRLTDYREYRTYDIEKCFVDSERKPISLKTYGTGSGGQLETPSYIVRSAALATALGWSQGDTHLRFVMIDETFEKVDVSRSKEVIQYLTEVLGVQMVFALPDGRSGPLHDSVDMLIDVSKIPAPEGIGELKEKVYLQKSILNRERVEALFREERARARERVSYNLDLKFAEGLDEQAPVRRVNDGAV